MLTVVHSVLDDSNTVHYSAVFESLICALEITLLAVV